jgi:hypothetical protein
MHCTVSRCPCMPSSCCCSLDALATIVEVRSTRRTWYELHVAQMARLTGPGSVPSDALFSCTFYLVMFILLYIANLISLNRLLALYRCFRRPDTRFLLFFAPLLGYVKKGLD